MEGCENFLESVQKLLCEPSNQVCIDCAKEKSQFASVYHGVFICHHCKEYHENFPQEINLLKSLSEPWSKCEFSYMVFGGNSRFSSFLSTYNIPPYSEITYKYSTVAIKYYRELLRMIIMGDHCEMPSPTMEEASNVIKLPRKQKSGISLRITSTISHTIEKVESGTESIKNGILIGKAKIIESVEKGKEGLAIRASKSKDSILQGVEKGKKGLEYGLKQGKEIIVEGLDHGKEFLSNNIVTKVKSGRDSIENGISKGFEAVGSAAHEGKQLGSRGALFIKTEASGLFQKFVSSVVSTYSNIQNRGHDPLVEENAEAKIGHIGIENH